MKPSLLRRLEKLEYAAARQREKMRFFRTSEQIARAEYLRKRQSLRRKYSGDEWTDRSGRWLEAHPEYVNLPAEHFPPPLMEDLVDRPTWWARTFPSEPYPEEWAYLDLHHQPEKLGERLKIWEYFRKTDITTRQNLWINDHPEESIPEGWSKQDLTRREWWETTYPSEPYPVDWKKKA